MNSISFHQWIWMLGSSSVSRGRQPVHAGEPVLSERSKIFKFALMEATGGRS